MTPTLHIFMKNVFTNELSSVVLRAILFFFLLIASLYSKAQTYNFRKYSVADGLSGALVYRSFQDSKGFIWFGTDAGVTRFDGTRFDRFTMDDGLADNEVFGVHEDRNGNIWFRTFNGRLSYFDGKKMHNDKTDPWLTLPDNGLSLHSFFEDKKGDIWISNFKSQIIHISGQKLEILHDFVGESIPHFIEDDQNRLVGISREVRKVYDPEKNQFQIIGIGAPLSSDMFFMLNNDLAYFYSIDKIVSVENGIEKVVIENFSPIQVNNITEGPDGMIYTCSRDLGVVVINPISNERKTLLNGVTVNFLMFDREENLWLCTRESGVWMIPKGILDVKVYNDRTGLSKSTIYDLAIDTKGRVWIGAYDNIIYCLENDELKTLVIPHEKDQKNRTQSILQTAEGQVIFAGDAGIFILNEKDYSLLEIQHHDARGNLVRSASAKVLASDRLGNIWCGKPGGLYRFDPSDKKPIAVLDSTTMGKKRTIAPFFDHEDNLWVSTSEGLYRVSQKDPFSSSSYPLTEERIKQIGQTSDRTMVFATDGIGILLAFNNVLTDTINILDGIQSNLINDIFIVGSTVWYASNKGIGQFELDKGHMKNLQLIGRAEGLNSENVKAVAVSGNNIYAGTDRGLCIIPQSIKLKNEIVPNMYIREVSGTWGKWTGDLNINADYTNNNLTVTFGAITFSQPEEVIYEYNLNQESTWIRCPGNFITLSQLPYKTNQIQIRARNKNSDWAYTNVLSFYVRPPFWRTTLFYILSGLLSASIIFLIFYFRYQRKLRLLEKSALINEERNRISADLHDDIGADLSRIVVACELLKFHNTEDKSVPVVNRVLEGARNVRSKVDNIIWALNPTHDSMTNFVSYIRQQGVEFFHDSNIQFELTAEKSGLDKRLTALQRRNLFLVLKEIFNNCLKHSGATHVKVHVSDQARALKICVSDNGKGMPKPSVHRWNNGGLTLNKRTKEIGGSIEWSESKGGGTTVCVLIRSVNTERYKID